MPELPSAANPYAMLKRAFTYLLLIHLTGALTLFSLSEPIGAEAPAAGQTTLAGRSAVTVPAPLLDLLGNLLSGTVPRESEHPGDHLADFFRIRKYTYRFLLWDAWLAENLTLPGAARPWVDWQKPPALFLGLVTLPDYYRLLFRLTPF